jgi:hypothetical protein
MSAAAIVIVVISAVLVVILLLLEPPLASWWRAPRVALRDLRSIRKLQGDAPAPSPVTKLFEWREGQWSKLAGALGALGVTLLVALVGASLDAESASSEKKAKEPAAQATPQPIPKHGKAAAADSDGDEDPQVVVSIVIGMSWLLATAAWQRARVVQNAYTGEVGRLMRITP